MKNAKQSLVDLAGPMIFRRGQRYFSQGRVQDVSFKEGLLSGLVQGSRAWPYKVKVYFRGNDGLHPECTCPYDWGEFCKHSVALLLAAGSASRAEEPPLVRQDEHDRSLAAGPDAGDDLYVRLYRQAPQILIRLYFSASGAVSSQGIKADINIVKDKDIFPLTGIKEFLGEASSNALYYRRNTPAKGLPSLSEFSERQQYYLKVLAQAEANLSVYSDLRLQPFHLSMLFNEWDDGIELFDARRKCLLDVCPDKPACFFFRLGLTAKGKLRVATRLLDPDDRNQALSLPECYFVEGWPLWLFDIVRSRFLPLPRQISRAAASNLLYQQEMILSQEQIPLFLDFLGSLGDNCRIDYADERTKSACIERQPFALRLYLDYRDKKVFAEPKFVYGSCELDIREMLAQRSFFVPLAGSSLKWQKRDIPGEKRVMDFFLLDSRFAWDGTGLVLAGDDDIFRFIYSRLPGIGRLAEDVEVFYSADFEKIKAMPKELEPYVRAHSRGINWFHFDVCYRAGGVDAELSHRQISRHLLAGKNYIRLKSGEFVPISRAGFQKAEELIAEYDAASPDLARFNLPFFIEECRRNNLASDLDPALLRAYEEIKRFKGIKKVDIPGCVAGRLRDYQKNGVEWLEFLRHFGFAGVLADEMGLGKTLQVLTILCREKEKGIARPSLVVCPTTLIWNWQAEIEKFLPQLKTLILSGGQRRQLFGRIDKVDIVITSYALLRRDRDIYKDKQFHYIVLDEAQNIKNRHTLNARASKQLRSDYRLVITGTPMENSVSDLWSIFDFLMPGFLGSQEKFKGRYEAPILKNDDRQRLEMLSRKLRPFILRREKTQVIKELPQKIEQVHWCGLEPRQAHSYREMLRLAQNRVLEAYEARGFQRSRMLILTVLLRLRQICCHPQLAGVNLGHCLKVSHKLNCLKELVWELLSGGHKVLVFSQFVEMLKIISQYLAKEKIAFSYMDGRTKDRRGEVERFNTDDRLRVFLLSLKVGGLGLNLTAADTVILYEPWWNPAVENQAIDRVHRIGQKNTVLAYKLITKGTIEERMLELQRRKANLIESLVVSEQGIAKKLGWEDIKFLLDMG